MATTASKQSKTAPKLAPVPVPEAPAEESAAPPRKKRSLLKILLLLTLLAGAAGGGAWYFLRGQEPATAPKPGAAKTAKAKQDPSKPPVFVTLEPFTVNLQHDDSAAQYLQVGLALKVNDESVVDKIKLHMPEIRNRILLLLSSKKASEISTLQGKQALSTELAREVGAPLAGSVPAQAIDSVLFTSFVIQ
ncbi:MAG: flagellar basal body-associated protein FliL [Burkholderiales bacterium]|jgi:flagellar FliL protein